MGNEALVSRTALGYWTKRREVHSQPALFLPRSEEPPQRITTTGRTLLRRQILQIREMKSKNRASSIISFLPYSLLPETRESNHGMRRGMGGLFEVGKSPLPGFSRLTGFTGAFSGRWFKISELVYYYSQEYEHTEPTYNTRK